MYTQGPHCGEWCFPDGTRLPFVGSIPIGQACTSQLLPFVIYTTVIGPTGIYYYSTNVMILRQINKTVYVLPVEVSALWEFTVSMIFLLEHLAKTDCSLS